MALNAQKVSASIPAHLLFFVKAYKQEHHLRSDSEVIAIALRKLEKTHLEQCYASAQKDLESDATLAEEAELWDKTAGDGIEPEVW